MRDPAPDQRGPMVPRWALRLLSAVLLAACASGGAGRPHPVAGGRPPGSLLARAQARDWTVRATTLAGDTLVGRVTVPAPGILRVRTTDVPLDALVSIERRVGSENALSTTKAIAGAAVGGMLGLVLGWVAQAPADAPCDGCNTKWFAAGAIAGLIAGVRAGRNDVDVRWEPLWRRE